MRSFQVIVLFCFIKLIAGGNYQNIDGTAQIEDIDGIGRYVTIGPKVKIFGNSGVGNYANVRDNAKIGPNCEIGSYTTIGNDAIITNQSIIGNYCGINQKVSISKSRISNYVTIGDRSILHDNCQIQGYGSIGTDADLSENVLMNSYSSIGRRVSVGTGSVFDRYSTAIDSSRIGSNVCIGIYARVGSNAIVEDNAVLHRYAIIQNGVTVSKDHVIIQTPSSALLYQACFTLDRLQEPRVDEFLNATDENANNILLGLMKEQFDQLVTQCPVADFILLRIITSLYLIKYHGRDSYEKYCKQSANGYSAGSIPISGGTVVTNQDGMFVNGQRVTNNAPNFHLTQEFHFGSNESKKLLNDEAKDQMIRLLAIQYDSQRNVRVQNDTYSTMLGDIKNNKRTVKCDT